MTKIFSLTHSNKQFLFIIGVLSAFCYMGFWWMYKLDVLPGLTGDEAWFGLRAIEYHKVGIRSFHGMNNYTGMLQSLLDAILFKYKGLSIIQMRMGGVMLNIIALLVFAIVFVGNGQKKVFTLFLLLMGQSCLYLIYPRIAWEVNSLNLFLTALNALCLSKLDKCKTKVSFGWSLLFLVTNIIGSYNHLIFSGLSIALLGGVILWSFYAGSSRYLLLLPLLFFNAVNVCILFVTEIIILPHFLIGWSMIHVAFFFLFAVVLECYGTRLLNKKLIFQFKQIPSFVIYWLLLLLFTYFSANHGSAFFDALCNYKIMVNVYGMDFSMIAKFLFFVCGSVSTVLLFWMAMKDLKDPITASSVCIFILIVYLATIPLYTVNIKLRYFHYYLIAYSLTAIYMAIKLASDSTLLKMGVPFLCLSLFISNVSMMYIFKHPDRPIIKQVQIGNTTGSYYYFVPTQPLIDSLKRNKIGTFLCPTDRNVFFIENIVNFSKQLDPWEELPENGAVIDYDQDPSHKNNFRVYKMK